MLTLEKGANLKITTKAAVVAAATTTIATTTTTTTTGAPGSSVGRASDSGSRSPGFETCAGHLVVGSDST